ncbi:MAG TPA: PIN domain-containing protein [Spirochaetota bacterium]|nr:PIN domain-containing protein [Spirochaetota bacterium]
MKRLKLYLDTCCYNRPFDDQTDGKIHLESEAIISILRLYEQNQIDIFGSEIIDFEISKIPDIIKRYKVFEISKLTKEKLIINNDVEERSLFLEKIGFKAFDALHIAIAEINKIDIFISTDRKLYNLSKKEVKNMLIFIKNPLEFIKEYYYEE